MVVVQSSLRAQRSNPVDCRVAMLLAMTVGLFFWNTPSQAQELGLLANVLEEDCQKYLNEQEKLASEYKSYCSAYFEALIEQKQHRENRDIFSCFPTYGDYDDFKSRVVDRFIQKYEIELKTDEYVRAFNLVNDSIEEQYLVECER